MRLTETEIKKFQEIYEKEFGEKLSKAKAISMGLKLINLIKTLLEFKVRK